MNTEETPKPKTKSLISIPFILIGLLLLAMIVPVVSDIDGDSKRDSVSKFVMYKIFSSQEDAGSSGEAIKGESNTEGGSGGLRGASADMGGEDKKDDDAKKDDDKKED